MGHTREVGVVRGFRNDYGDLIERWKVDLIRERSRRFFFRQDEIPDIEQIVVMELLNADHRPDIPGGASETTFVIAVSTPTSSGLGVPTPWPP